jgi:EAL domain-containing protein (putative c-di-GMP-specific phosphodiesterase class I)
LETLYRLDLDNAKVDQAFIKGLQSDAKNRQLLRDIITMIRGLGLDVVVEGIETKVQLEFINSLDCHYGQGFLFAKSIPEDEVCKLLEDPPDFGG